MLRPSSMSILDEPTAALDERAVENVKSFVKQNINSYYS